MTIADVNDGLYDSQIYFKQGSFTPYKYPRIMLNNNYYALDTIVLCDGNNITLSVPDGANINWNTGDTTNSIVVSQPGTYSAYYSNSTCFYNPPSITVIEEDTIPVTISASGSTTFSLPSISLAAASKSAIERSKSRILMYLCPR